MAEPRKRLSELPDPPDLTPREARAVRAAFTYYADVVDCQDPETLITWPMVARDVREWLWTVGPS